MTVGSGAVGSTAGAAVVGSGAVGVEVVGLRVIGALGALENGQVELVVIVYVPIAAEL